eukprot:symbB.v1.2.006315.t2/scaffold354.1/size221495/10
MLLEHIAGSGSKELQSSAIAKSWVVVPVIFSISSGITGILRGAGSRTTIYFNFTVVQSASELQIDALEPVGFEFQDSYAAANISGRRSVPQILVATWDALRLVILADSFDNIYLTIADVKISEVPGASRWRLSTWELPEDDKEGTPYIRDEAYMQGFLVPGLLQVFNAFGQTGRENAAILGRESDLSFDMTSSAPLQAGSDLLVAAKGAGHAGFKLFGETAELWTLNAVSGAPETKLGEWYCTGMRDLFDPENETAQNLSKEMYLPDPSACEWDETRREMIKNFDHTSNQTRIANVVVLKITKGAPVESQLRLKFKVETPTDRTTFLEERWHIDVQLVNHTNGMINLVTTNDGGPVPLSVVTQLPTEPPPEPSHVAPLTRVQVVIQLDPLDTGAEAFALTAPLTAALQALRKQQENSLRAIDALLLSAAVEDERIEGNVQGLKNIDSFPKKDLEQEDDGSMVEQASAQTEYTETSKEKPGNYKKGKSMNLLAAEGSKFRDLIDDGEKREVEHKSFRDWCQWLVSRPQFDWAIGFVIFLNSICIGIETQQSINRDLLPGWPGEAIDYVFISIYLLEILLRVFAFGAANLRDGWFIFDVLLVAMGFVGNIIESIMTAAVSESESGFVNILVVRSLRLLRLVRALRMLRIFRTVWRLVYGLLTSGNAMLSTFFILLLTLYIYACLGVEFITKDPLLKTHDDTREIVSYYFGSLQRTLLTLISFIHADSINTVYQPICLVRPWLIIFFTSLILTVSVSLMNLVTAVLVEGALANAANDKELSRHDMKEKVKKFAPKIMEVFTEIDADGNGTIDREELEQINLSQLPFELSSEFNLEELFDMLDVEEKGTLTQTEFADGLLHLLTMDMPIHTMKTFKLLYLHGSMLDTIQSKLLELDDSMKSILRS